MTNPTVEELQPIADKLAEASAKVYEAVELAAKMNLKARQLSNICSVVEHVENVQIDLLEAAKVFTPRAETRIDHSLGLGYGGAIGLGISGRRLREMQDEHLEAMKAELAEQVNYRTLS